MEKRLVYLDHNATTPLHPEVKKTMREAMEVFGNPSSLHEFGRLARTLIESSRRGTALFINAVPEDLVFVGSGSEANNTILSIFSCCATRHCSCHSPMRTRMITTKIEHPCVLEASRCLAERGMTVDYLEVDGYGRINIDQLKDMLKAGGVGIVSVMMANNEIGTVQDIKAITGLVHAHGALMHTDAVQAVGKLPVDVKDLDVDFLSLSGHKIYGPKGIGAMYIKKGTPFCPFIRGGHQEQGRRAGTENTIGIAGLETAIEMRSLEMAAEAERLKGLKKILRDGIIQDIPDIRFNGHLENSLPGTLNVSFAGAEGEAILLYLDLEGIAVSTGSACASGSLDPSHVLLACGLPAEQAHSSIRISMGRDTTVEEVAYFLRVMPQVIKRIRGMSSAYGSAK